MRKVGSVVALFLLAGCPPNTSEGQAIYNGRCVACHGPDGTLGVVVNEVPAADLTTRVAELTDEEITTAVIDGVGEMVPVASVTEDDMPALLLFLRAEFGGGE